MINPNSNKAIISFSFLLVSLLFHSIPSAYADFITDTCQKTSIPPLCESTLRSDPRSAQMTTVKDLAKISFDISINSALAANRQASDLERQNRGKPEEHPLGECAALYMSMMTDLQNGEGALRDDSYGKANDFAGQAQQEPGQCEIQFQKSNIQSLLSDTDDQLQKKAGVCMALTKLLIPGPANSRKIGSGF
ncbi:hypothetical protein LUZ60_009828 [Juncus effusus]|nr:hypothetical protein LUZ60_009828 [Juncus effusus]